MVSSEVVLRQLQRLAPDIARCAGEQGGMAPEHLIEKAIATGCKKIQLFTPFFECYKTEYCADYVKEIVEKAHNKGLICNLCIADDPRLAEEYLSKGVDTLLTNDYQRIRHIISGKSLAVTNKL